MIGFHGSRTGDARTAGFRGAGTAEANASRTVRRCVSNRRDSSRIDTSGSTRRALRISSNNSTLDLFVMNPRSTTIRPARRIHLNRWGQIR
jgi:hypothetical protein